MKAAAVRTSQPDPQSAQQSVSTEEALALGLRYFQSGQLTEAEQLYRQILQHHPEQPDALQWLGVIAYQMGRVEEGFGYLRKSLNLKPEDANAQNSFGVMLMEQGDLPQATIHLQRAIALNPNHFFAHANLGSIFLAQGTVKTALQHLRIAFSLNPNFPLTHVGLGIAMREEGQLELAAAHLKQAIALAPQDASAHYNLGLVLDQQDQLAAAIACYRQAITLNPKLVEAYISLGNLFREQNQLAEAILTFQSAVAIAPDNPAIHTGLGVALQEQHQFEPAIAHLQRVIDMNPTAPQSYCNLGAALWSQEKCDRAIDAYRKAIEIDPDYAEAHVCLAQAFLTAGRIQEGFTAFEWRWQIVEHHAFAQPEWDGSPLNGQPILLTVEGGFGDIIHFVRYATLVSDRGGQVILSCPPPLAPLLVTVPGVAQVVTDGQPLPPFVVHASLMSLPRILGTTLATIPAQIPYVFPPVESAVTLELDTEAQLKVGVVWASGYKEWTNREETRKLRQNYHTRSCPFSLFKRILTVADIQFYSLQIGHNATDLAELDGHYLIQDLSSSIHSFADTAAIIQQLDLVISVDTAVPHLAGAMGKPVWLILSRPHDWRWMLDREDTPWYPTIRLFRQSFPGDWDGVIDRVVNVLEGVRKA